MIGKIRYLVSLLIPNKLKWWLVRSFLPECVNFTAKSMQGIDKVWQYDIEFETLYNMVSNKILLDKKRAFVLYTLSKNCNFIDGNYAELGVYKGAGSKIILEASRNKDIYLFDTFEGLPETNSILDPYWGKGDLNDTSLEEVESFLNSRNVLFFKGFFPESAKEIHNDIKFSFVHIDVDIYQSCVDACHYFYPKMTKGGIILFDDYGFLSCPGVRKAVNDFFINKNEQVIYFATGQCMIIKQ